jgi:hypothetical protein
MTELSLELQQLVDAAKFASRPTDADCARVLAGIHSRLGIADAAPQGASRLLATKAIVASIAGLTLVVAGTVLLVSKSGGTAQDTSLPGPSMSATAQAQVAVGAAADLPQTSGQPQVNAASPENAAASVVTAGSPRRPSRPQDSLAEELAILSRAEQELHSGQAESALRLLNEHERKYRNGKLAEERTAARIQALCAVGRVTEANALLGRLSPNSLHGESARQACSSTKNERTDR